jgi:hypothetical protein
MPYKFKKEGTKYCVFKKDTNEKVGCTDGNKESLQKYLAALHANEGEICSNCAIKLLKNIKESIITEATYQGKTVTLNKPTRGDVAKYKVYVKNDAGNVVKVNFGDKNMSIKRDDPARRKSFRARHKCDQKKDKDSAGYWSCKFWSTKSVTDILKGK